MSRRPDITADWPAKQSLIVAAAILLTSGLTTLAANLFLAARFLDRPAPPDLLLRVTPYVKPAEYVTEFAMISSLVLLFVYTLGHARLQFAETIAAFGIMYILRSVLMVLTPLASSQVTPGDYGLIPISQLGMFPSGHAAASLLCFLMIDPSRAAGMKRLALGLMATQWVALILARGHYSIDIVGGALLGYFVYREWQDGSLFDPVRRLMGVRRSVMPATNSSS